MREIKFRGKVSALAAWRPCEWIIGALETAPNHATRIIEERASDKGVHHSVIVDKVTIGEFTGARDISNREIFEGDLVTVFGHGGYVFEVEFRKSAFVLKGRSFDGGDGKLLALGNINPEYIKIIGNIHDRKV